MLSHSAPFGVTAPTDDVGETGIEEGTARLEMKRNFFLIHRVTMLPQKLIPLPMCKMRWIDLIALYRPETEPVVLLSHKVRKLGPIGGAESLSKSKERALSDGETDLALTPSSSMTPRQVADSWLQIDQQQQFCIRGEERRLFMQNSQLVAWPRGSRAVSIPQGQP